MLAEGCVDDPFISQASAPWYNHWVMGVGWFEGRNKPCQVGFLKSLSDLHSQWRRLFFSTFYLGEMSRSLVHRSFCKQLRLLGESRQIYLVRISAIVSVWLSIYNYFIPVSPRCRFKIDTQIRDGYTWHSEPFLSESLFPALFQGIPSSHLIMKTLKQICSSRCLY